MAATEELLRLGPGVAETRALLAEVEAALERRAAPAAAPPLAPQPAPAAPAWLDAGAGGPAPDRWGGARVVRRSRGPEPAPNWSVLQLVLQSSLRRGVLVLYVGERRLLTVDLEDLLAADASPPPIAHLVPAGESRLRVYVTPPRQAARLATVVAELPGGAARLLRVSVTATGEVNAWLL
jgi:hypothetical protein